MIITQKGTKSDYQAHFAHICVCAVAKMMIFYEMFWIVDHVVTDQHKNDFIELHRNSSIYRTASD